jgi:hypothetical protein
MERWIEKLELLLRIRVTAHEELHKQRRPIPLGVDKPIIFRAGEARRERRDRRHSVLVAKYRRPAKLTPKDPESIWL